MEINYDEDQVQDYTLPEPLMTAEGEKIESKKEWFAVRRPELLRLFSAHVYGWSPGPPEKMKFLVESEGELPGGGGLRRQIRAVFTGSTGNQRGMDILIYLPADSPGPVPLFLGLNFYGNQTIHRDPEIKLAESWIRNNEEMGITDNRATEDSRGRRENRWPVEMILERGYGLATIYYGDLCPDYDGGFGSGVHALFAEEDRIRRRDDEWGAIGAWAWGLSRALDYFEADEDIDHECVAVIGHSRLGKTALWAGAQDERFAIVISNNSGCGGASLSRRNFGETVERINNSFPHWFCRNFRRYGGNEEKLPIDQHLLIALAAPRPVYVGSAEEDQWADPRGEFLSALNADPVYRLLETEGLPVNEMPGTDRPVKEGRIGYHIRSGGHDLTPYDWTQYMDFADKHLSE